MPAGMYNAMRKDAVGFDFHPGRIGLHSSSRKERKHPQIKLQRNRKDRIGIHSGQKAPGSFRLVLCAKEG
eukprot:scaffold65011_cov21-Tisochrysis_lutea.AAC.1